MNLNNPDDLEKYIHKTLRSLPERKAPEALIRRMEAAIAAREAMPWWQKGFSAWPMLPRVIFMFVSAFVVAFFLFTGTQLFGGASLTDLSARFGAVGEIYETVVVARIAVIGVLNSIPPLWLYGGVAALAALYATIVGLGAVCYRSIAGARA